MARAELDVHRAVWRVELPDAAAPASLAPITKERSLRATSGHSLALGRANYS
jgi:hypothetical protein